jgi:hypothetical protein
MLAHSADVVCGTFSVEKTCVTPNPNTYSTHTTLSQSLLHQIHRKH